MQWTGFLHRTKLSAALGIRTFATAEEEEIINKYLYVLAFSPSLKDSASTRRTRKFVSSIFHHILR